MASQFGRRVNVRISYKFMEYIKEIIPIYLKIILSWPTFAFVVLFVFQTEIRQILNRIKKGKIFGNEFELEKEIDKFDDAVEAIENEIPQNLSFEEGADKENKILSDSISDPKIGILVLAREIEKEIRKLIGSLGLLKGENYRSVHQSFEALEQRGSLPKHTIGALKIFWKLRNEVVHGKEIDNEKNVIRVLDIGMTLLRTLKSIPHEINRVYHPGVDIYVDAECTEKYSDVKGLILETISPGGIEKTHRIFPTTKSKYYKKGERVAWEWNLSNVWGEAWYINLGTKKKAKAWSSAGEFIGRHINEI